MAIKELTFKDDIARLLRTELGNSGAVALTGEELSVTVSRTNYEQNYIAIVRQIHQLIDDHYPDRHENLFILMRDEAGNVQSKLKIWKPV